MPYPLLEKDTIVRKVKGFSLPAGFRLKKRKEFRVVQEQGAKLYSPHFLLILRPSQTGDSRLGVTVTLKIDKRATRRNLLKRRLRELFRLNRARFVSPVDIVIIARKDAADCSFDEIEREVLGVLERKGYLKNDRSL